MRLLYGGWGVELLDGGTRSRVYWAGMGVNMGVYYTPIYTYLSTTKLVVFDN